MKKLIASTLAVGMFLCTPVSAENIQDFLTDGSIHMEIENTQGDSELMLMVMPETKKWENADQWRADLFPGDEKPIVMDTVTKDKNGKYSVDFALADMGTYNVYVGSEKYIIRYTNKTLNEAANEALLGKESADEVYAMLCTDAETQKLSLNSEIFNIIKKDTKEVDEKTVLENVAEMLYNELSNYSEGEKLTCEKVQSLTDKACLVAMLNGNSNAEVTTIDDWLDVAEINELDLKKYYKKEKAPYLTTYLKETSISGISDFDQKLFEGLLYTNIKYNDNTKTVIDMLDEYADEIGITKKSNITDSMVRTMVGQDFTSLSQVAEHVNGYTEPVKKPQGLGGANGGGSNRAPSSAGISGVAQPPKEDNPILNSDVFDDLDSVEWAKEAINSLALRGIVAGRTANEFMPNDAITREEFVKLIVTSLSLNVSGDDMNFDDVAETDWFYKYVRSAFNAEIINGVSENLFGTGRNITREDMAVIVARALDVAGVKVDDAYDKQEFADVNEISDYARESVESLQKKGIMVGTDANYFMPQNNATRAEAAQIIFKILKNIA